MVTMMVTMMTKRTATWYGAEGGGTASSGAEEIMVPGGVQELWRCGTWGHGQWAWWVWAGVRFGDLRGLFQPEWFCGPPWEGWRGHEVCDTAVSQAEPWIFKKWFGRSEPGHEEEEPGEEEEEPTEKSEEPTAKVELRRGETTGPREEKEETRGLEKEEKT